MTLPEFAEYLLEWYRQNGRSLPWRDSQRTPYSVWVSEIMLQQTQVSRVIPYYTRFLTRFPTVNKLAKTSWEDFLPYYQGLGYYARGRNMLKTAQTIVNEFQGVFPSDRKKLLSLPGIGEYTADAILSFGFGQPRLAIDVNVKRIVSQHIFESSDLDDIDWEYAREALNPYAPDINSALMDYAAANKPKKMMKEKSTFPAKSAQTFLILHENHKTYFSENEKVFRPFVLPAPLNSRASIKEYFDRNYGLELSIRPPRAQGFIDETPTNITFAQVLKGKNTFSRFTSHQAKPIWEDILNSLE